MKQVTLVSLYGQKAKGFASLLEGCADIIMASPLRRVFSPYHPQQVHATLVGMEKVVGYTQAYNANEFERSGKKVSMDFGPLLETVKTHFPMEFQFGGFPKSFIQFNSFGRWPYERSFQVQWPANRFTVIGWPHQNGDFTGSRLLAGFRDAVAQNCSIRHKYTDDNDLFLVVGEISGLCSLTDAELDSLQQHASHVEHQVRDLLVGHKTPVTIALEDIVLVQYEKETLPLDSSLAHRVTNPGVDASFISRLY